MVIEEWRTVAFAPDYAVSSTGRVKRVVADRLGRGEGRILRTPVGDAGYPCCSIHVNGKQHHRRVYRLVAEAFLGPKPTPRHEVRHLDGDPLNTRADNLAWGTSSQNKADCLRHGTRRQRGEGHTRAKLTDEQVRCIRSSAEHYRALAERYDVSPNHIHRLRGGRAWKHVSA